MASCTFLFSQDILKEWREIPCENLESIHNDANYPQIWRCETESNQYVCSANFQGVNEIIKLYQFTANGEKATLTEIVSYTNLYVCLLDGEKPYLEDEKSLVDPYSSEGSLTIAKRNMESNRIVYWSDIPVSSEKEFQCFLMNNNHYLLVYSKDTLQKLDLNSRGSISIVRSYSITPAKPDTSILILKDTLYYFSDSGFCAVKISDDSATSEVISNVTVTDEKSLLATDKQNKIWIMNQTDGVIEYNTNTKEAKKLLNFLIYLKQWIWTKFVFIPKIMYI